MADELLDRYGDLPKSVTNLMKIAELKAKANRASIREIKAAGKTVKLTVISEPKFDVARIPEIIQSFKGMFTIQTYPNETFFVYRGPRDMDAMLKNLGAFCDALAQ